MQKMWKRLTSLALALMLLVGMLPTVALKAEAATSSANKGYKVEVENQKFFSGTDPRDVYSVTIDSVTSVNNDTQVEISFKVEYESSWNDATQTFKVTVDKKACDYDGVVEETAEVVTTGGWGNTYRATCKITHVPTDHSNTYTANNTNKTITQECSQCNHKTIATLNVKDGGVSQGATEAPATIAYSGSAWSGTEPRLTYNNNGPVGEANVTMSVGTDVSVSDTYQIKANTYTVTFNYNNGSDAGTQNVASNGTITEPAEPTKEGYVFGGWYTDEACTDAYNFDTAVTGDVDLYAKWTAVYTVSFDSNDGSGSMSAETLEEGTTYTLPECGFTAPTGKQFKSWKVGDTEYEEGDTITVNANTTVVAQWEDIPVTTYTVTFNANGHGTAPAAQTVEAGNKATTPTAPTAEGYTFGGWYTEAACTNAYNFDTPVTGDVDLYAKWTKVAQYNAVVTLNNYGLNKSISGINVTVTASGLNTTNLSARIHSDNGGVPGNRINGGTFNAGTQYWLRITLSKNSGALTKEDVSATLTNSCQDIRIVNGTGPNNGKVLVYFKLNPLKQTYTVTFNANGHGAAPAAQTVEAGNKATVPTAPTAEGYTFGGWYKEAACTNAYDFNTAVTGNITLYAKWTKNPESAKIKLNGYELGKSPNQTSVEMVEGTVTIYSSTWSKDHSFHTDIGGEPNKNQEFNEIFTAGTQYWLRVTLNKTGVDLSADDVIVTLSNGCQDIQIIDGTGGNWQRVYVYFKLNPLQAVTATPEITYNEETFTVTATGNGTVKLYVNGTEVAKPYTFTQGEEDATYVVTATAQEDGKAISATAKETITVPARMEVTATPTIAYDAETFTVTATGNGTVKLYVNGTEVANPYTFTQGEEDATYAVTATAQENGKLISATAERTITVPARMAVTATPTITYNEATFTVTATGNGTVKLFIDGEEATNPHAFSLSETAATYKVTATAQEDGKAISATAERTITVPARTAKPTIAYDAETFTVTATGDGTVVLYIDGVAAVTNSYTFTQDETDKNYVVTATAQENGKLISEVATLDVTVPALSKYGVVFIVNGHGNAPGTQSVFAGRKAEAPENPEEAGYTFEGWYADEKLETPYDFDNPVNNHITLYAKWTPTEYTITYNLNDGTAEGNLTTYTIETETFTLTNPTKEGFTFQGWTGSNGDTAEKEVKVEKGSTGNLKFIANWFKYEIIDVINGEFDLGGDAEYLIVKANGEISKFSGVKVDGNDVAEDKYVAVSGSTIVKLTREYLKDLSAGAHSLSILYNDGGEASTEFTIKAAPVVTYTVTFNANGRGTAPAAQTINAGAKASEPAALTEEGWTFGGWYTDADCTEENAYDFDTAVNADITLYAKWTAYTFKVHFDANGGGGNMDPQTFTYDVEQALTANAFTKAGHTFAGWKDAAGTSYADKAVVKNLISTNGGEVTLTAQWTAITVNPNNFEVKYDANGGTGAPAPQPATEGKLLQLSSIIPTRPGYKFKYWATQSGVIYHSGYSYEFNADVTLYAQWEMKALSVSFNANGGSGVMSPVYVQEGKEYILPGNGFTPPSGMVFDCWVVGGQNYKPGDKITVNGDLVVAAQWKVLNVYSGSSSGLDYVPKTGDASGIMQWMGLLLFSAVALAGYEFFRKRSVK